MKKLLVICICLSVLSGFSFARDGKINNFDESNFSHKQASESSIKISQKNTLRQKAQNSCISGQKLLVSDNLSKKAQEASEKVIKLIELTTKLRYNNKNLSDLAQKLQILSSKIEKDCLSSDFQEHREQIKSAISSLKIEISLIKHHVSRLRKR